MSQIGLIPFYRAVDTNGNPLASARLYTFLTGTLTPQAVYTDESLDTSHGAYVQADANGLFPQFYPDPTKTYRYQLRVSPYSAAVSGYDADPVTSLSSGAITFLQAGTGAVTRTVQSKLRETISLADFGYVANGVTDDLLAWQRAITAAAAAGVGIIEVPWGATGVSIVSGSICNGTLPPGLRFVGIGAGSGSYRGNRPTLRYTGSGVCWNIVYPSYATIDETGDWAWENMIFDATDYDATMFSFQDPLTHNPVDGAGYSYLRNVAFRNVLAGGAGEAFTDGGKQNGDFLRAAKLFHLEIDHQCFIASWRRGLWLKGCDNSRISGRFIQNNRHVMIEGSGGFGNDNMVDSRFFGPITIAGTTDVDFTEPAYLLWDDAKATTVLSTFFEETADISGYPAGAARATALVYLNGFGTRLLGPLFGGAALFELGPDARECGIADPLVTIFNAGWAPIINTATTTDFGYNQGDYRLTVTNPRENAQRIIGTNPRLIYFNQSKGYEALPDYSRQLTAGSAGIQPVSHICHALDFWSRHHDVLFSGGAELIADATSSTGWAIKLNHSTLLAGMTLRFVVGTDIQPGWFRALIRTKGANTSWSARVDYDPTGANTITTVTPANSPGSYATSSQAVDGTGWVIGKEVLFQIFKNGSPAADLYADFAELRPVAVAVTAPTGGATVDTEGRAATASILLLLREKGLMA